ncbi:MAG: thioredoxin-dependent thiol peroxidase [Pyrinomonadaceae bacterium]|nr:thioredoxin-dependent thiol peroxidase [Pyrinomonadaceae bacterium]
MLKEGDIAPDFSVKDQNGEVIKLSDFRGKKVVLYFYPKDDTPGCTKEACSLRDGFADLEANGIEILGVSTDDEKSHQKFISKYELPFTLLADTDHAVADAYESYGEKTFMGKTYNGVLRKTFLIDADGKIKKVFDKVKVDEHAAEVLKAFGE